MRGFIKKITVVAIALVAVIAVASTGISADAASKKPTKITLKATSKTVDIKGKVTVSVKSVKPAKASKSVTWKSSNKKIATVSSKGVVTGKKKGTVKITATSKKNKKVKATVTIKVKNLVPTKVTLSKKTVELTVGNTRTLSATVKPVGVYNKGVTWKSSKTSVATVSSKGKITAKSAGTATITATTKEGKKKATCKVTVTEAAAPEITYNTISAADLKADIAKADHEYVILDVRAIADYKKAHVVTSISADVDCAVTGSDTTTASNNLKSAIGEGKGKYVLVCYSGNAYAKKATELLIALGVSNDNIFTLTGGFGGKGGADPNATWKDTQYVAIVDQGEKDDREYNKITSATLLAELKAGTNVYTVLDVRKNTDYVLAHIKGSISADVDAGLDDSTNTTAVNNVKNAIGDGKGIYVLVCYSGNSYARTATAILKNLGVADNQIYTLQGGFGASGGTGTPNATWSSADYSAYVVKQQ